MPRTISRLFRAAVDDAAGAPWLFAGDDQWTYADAQAAIERAASALRAEGVEPGNRVLVTARNDARYLLVWFALMEVGAVEVPLNPASSVAELAGFVRQVGPALVVADATLAPDVERAVVEA